MLSYKVERPNYKFSRLELLPRVTFDATNLPAVGRHQHLEHQPSNTSIMKSTLSTPQSIVADMSTGRRYDLDWLRFIAIVILLFFHTGMLFNPWD